MVLPILLACLGLCGLGLRGAAPPAAVLPPAFEETMLVDFNAARATLAVNGAVSYEPVADPAGLARTVLKVSYPAYVKGDPEWPALKVPAAALASADWRGRDTLVLRVYNPDNDVVDIGLFVREGEARHGPHMALQPNVWNTVMFPLAAFAAQKLPLEKIAEVHVFMTRPARALTLYLSTLSLLRERDLRAVPFPMRLSLAGFEADNDLKSWQANGVTARLTEAARLGGRRALELVFPAYEQGGPRWPSYQARYGERALPLCDWSAYERFCFEVRNPGKTAAPLRVCFWDQAGAQASVLATVSARGRLAFVAPLRDLALDVSRLVQVDLYMSEPAAAHTLWVDDLRLEAAPFGPADCLLERLDAARREASQSGAAELSSAYRQTGEVMAAMRSGLEQKPTFGGARLLAEAVPAATRQADRLDRELQMARLLAATRSRVAGAAFGVGVADSMTKVMIRDQPLAGVTPAERVDLELARNEWESFQIVVTGAGQALTRVRVEPGTFRHTTSGQGLPEGVVTSSLVGFVKTKKPPYAVPYVGWWPDPLLDFQTESKVQPGEAVPFWIRVHLPKDAVAGCYEGTVTVRAEGCSEVTVPVVLRVFDVTLPDLSFLPTACSFYDNIKRIWGKEMSEDEYQRRLTAAAEFLACYKIGLDHIYRQPKEDPAALDLPVAQLRLLKERGLLRRFMIFHVATPGEVTAVDDPAVQKTIDLCLRNLEYWVPRLQQEGLLEFAYLYGYDEVPAKAFPVLAKVFGEIKKAYPTLPLMTTAYDDSFGLKTELAGTVDWWVPLTPKFDPERVVEARAHGMEVWWYICIEPKHPTATG
jgi:hypothetical protein